MDRNQQTSYEEDKGIIANDNLAIGSVNEFIVNSTDENANVCIERDEDYTPKKSQTAIGVTMVVSMVISLCGFHILYILCSFLFNNISYGYTLYTGLNVISIIAGLLLAVCMFMLSRMANNKATRIGTLIFFVSFLIDVLRAIASSEFIDFSESFRQYFNNYFSIFCALGGIYACGLLIRNNLLSSKNKSWIAMLLVLTFLGGCDFGQNFVPQAIFPDYFICKSYFNILSSILIAAAYWNLARCCAFSGKYNAAIKGDYSPLNKYMIAPFVCVCISFLFSYLLFSNYELFNL